MACKIRRTEMIIQFTIPELPVTLNLLMRMHYQKRGVYDRRWKEQVHWTLIAEGLLPPKLFSKAEIFLYRFSPRMLDFDNLVGSFKPVVDALKGVVIVDDRKAILGDRWEVSQIQCRKADSRIVVRVEERS